MIMCFSRSSFRRTSRAARGFTIIELLVSVGITALMLTLMVTIAINMLNGWNRTSGQLTTGNQARIVLDQISQDLQAAVLRRDGNIWLAATVQQDQTGNGDANIGVAPPGFFRSDWTATGQRKPASSGAPPAGNSLDLAGSLPVDNTDKGRVENVRFGQLGVWLRFFTSPPAPNNPADLTTTSAPRAVSYQISRGQLGGGAGADAQFIYALFRTEMNPVVTFQQGYNITGAPYDTAAGAAGAIRKPTVNEIIATNVVDFGVRLYERSGNRLVERFPVKVDYTTGKAETASTTTPVHYLATSDNNATDAYASFGGGTQLTNGLPVAAEIMVRILTPEGVRQIQALENNLITRPPGVASDAEYWWQIVDQNSQVYTRRVEIRSTAL
jgi:type II secretory pathway pseudopilin PulG